MQSKTYWTNIISSWTTRIALPIFMLLAFLKPDPKLALTLLGWYVGTGILYWIFAVLLGVVIVHLRKDHTPPEGLDILKLWAWEQEYATKYASPVLNPVLVGLDILILAGMYSLYQGLWA